MSDGHAGACTGDMAGWPAAVRLHIAVGARVGVVSVRPTSPAAAARAPSVRCLMSLAATRARTNPARLRGLATSLLASSRAWTRTARARAIRLLAKCARRLGLDFELHVDRRHGASRA
ncbi:hypothetical protein ZWY2020_029547 [Hordeum vulgare]|nr:hypothetical protein ZWY2020_024556 [Hordeum vulgare]KAI5013364.1 hypothetical protein ZWY2020_029547 [Hordeum vulgare]